MKTKSFSIINFSLSIALVLLLTACDGMKTELDITSVAFPPKLSVTAMLDGGEGSLSIAFTEGRALADYAKPFPDNHIIIRNGEIRLYEDGNLIWNQQGPFDMSVGRHSYKMEGWEYESWEYRNGYVHIEYGIVTHAGSEYRLEVEVDGYETAVSTVIMPDVSAVTASIDASSEVMKDKINFISSLSENMWNNWDIFWPLTVQITDSDPNERKYYALDISMTTDSYRDGVYVNTYDERHGIGVTELSKLQDNPDVEAGELLINVDPANMYYFTMLLQSNVTFSRENNTLNYYIGRRQQSYYPSCSEELPSDVSPSSLIMVTSYNKYSLRVKRITTETFRYYRSLTLQNAGMEFFSEPVTVVGNIEKGYGCFSVINSVNIPLIEIEDCHYFISGYLDNYDGKR